MNHAEVAPDDSDLRAKPSFQSVQIDWEAILINGTLHMFGYSRDVTPQAVSQ